MVLILWIAVNLEFFDSPIPHIIIKKFLKAEEQEKIWEEIDEIKDGFKTGMFVKDGKEQVIEGKTNTGVIVNDRFPNIDDSYLRSLFWYRFQMNPDFAGAIQNARDPFWSIFSFTVAELTKVSRYGNDDKYDWHNDICRTGLITIIYQLAIYPSHFTGGDFVIKNTADEVKTIPFEDNSVIIFPRMYRHRITTIHSKGNNFYDARFSIQWFVNIK